LLSRWLPSYESCCNLLDGDALAYGRPPDPLDGDLGGEAVAFHDDSRGLLDYPLRFWAILHLASLLRMGPSRRLQLDESSLRHLEDGQRLYEEFGCRFGDVLKLVGGPVGPENIKEHAVMDSGEIQHAQVLPYGSAAEFIGGLEPRLTPVGQILEEGGSVVAPEPLVGVSHHASRWYGAVEARTTDSFCGMPVE
jgi:hypothetical protein